jgi:hypothetical protein
MRCGKKKQPKQVRGRCLGICARDRMGSMMMSARGTRAGPSTSLPQQQQVPTALPLTAEGFVDVDRLTPAQRAQYNA